MKYLLLLVAALAILVSCNTQRPISDPANKKDREAIEQRNLDTVFVTAPAWDEEEELSGTQDEGTYTLPKYNPSYTRTNDLLHTKLDLRFDWQKEQVLGKATLRLKPLFYPTNQVKLDAKGFEFKKVTFEGKNEPLQYNYENDQITIQLGRTFTRDETYTLYIEYVATPTPSGGSAAIGSDRGLYFIDPRNEDPEKPTQIWTQGETESNSRWFPTIDKPNERCTQEMYLTVEDKYVTLSNGLLVSSKKNADGTRTDYWRMDQPHAPYLFMIAIGEYAVVRDKWRDIPLEYYVEPKYKDHAKAIFAHTPEMLEFFSNKLNLKYPWKKYAQVVVRDYVSGAMENTTAVIFGEFVQRTTRELIDDNNDRIVAHEMFHHWFGDYVTCESWANLTMNEGFANYAEYLWNEYKYGADEADYHLMNEVSTYFSSARGNMHPLIHFGYDDKEDMFDAHSYNKGGAVLHMLRNYVGDEAFFAALNKYLIDNAYKAVEAHNLRLAFEELTGEDMNWFFNQWFFAQGHPELTIAHYYNEETKSAEIMVSQTQSTQGGTPAIFQLPIKVDVYAANGKKERHSIWVKEREQTFAFPAAQKPINVIFDAERVLLAEKQETKDEAAYIFQYRNGQKFMDRYEALQNLAYSETADAAQIFKEALKDRHWVIRAAATTFVEDNTDEAVMQTLRNMAASDPRPQVRAAAFEKLTELEDDATVSIAQKAIQRDSSYTVIAAALQALVALDSQEAITYAQRLENEDNNDILGAIAGIYAQSGEAKYLVFFEKNLTRVDGYSAIDFMDSYQTLATSLDFAAATTAIEKMKSIAMNLSQSLFRRFGAARALNQMRLSYNQQAEEESNSARRQALRASVASLTQILKDIKAFETNEQLQSLYDQLIQLD